MIIYIGTSSTEDIEVHISSDSLRESLQSMSYVTFAGGCVH